MPSRYLVIVFTALGLLLRVATLGVQSYWSDEAATIALLHQSFGGMLHGVVDGESTPPLFYVIAWPWTHLAGTGEVAARLPSALFSTATVPVVAAVAGRLTAPGRDAGRASVLAAALAATGPLMVWYGQEARSYALLMLLTAGSVLALLRVLEDPSSPGRAAAWAALAVAAFWTHHFALFPVAAEAAWMLWALRARAFAAVGGVTVGAVALAPLLLHQRAAGRASFIAQESLGRRLAQLPKQVLVGYDGPAEIVLTLVGAVAILIALSGLTRAGGPRRPTALAVVLGVTTAGVLLPVLAALAGQDFVLTRNLLGVLPLALAVVGAAAARVPGRVAGPLAVGVLSLTGVGLAVAVASDPRYQRDDFRAALRAATGGPGGPRLVVADQEGRLPVGVYLGRTARVAAPGSALVVGEIDVVKVAGARPGGTRTTPTLSTAVVPPGFSLAGTQTGPTWAVLRFVAPAPVAVDPGSLAPLDPGKGSVVFFRPR